METLAKVRRWTTFTVLFELAMGFAAVVAHGNYGRHESNHLFAVALAVLLANVFLTFSGYLGAACIFLSGMAAFSLGAAVAIANPAWGHSLSFWKALCMGLIALGGWWFAAQAMRRKSRLPASAPSDVKTKGDVLRLTEAALAELRQNREWQHQNQVIGAVILSVVIFPGLTALFHLNWYAALPVVLALGVGTFYFTRWASGWFGAKVFGDARSFQGRFEGNLLKLQDDLKGKSDEPHR